MASVLLAALLCRKLGMSMDEAHSPPATPTLLHTYTFLSVCQEGALNINTLSETIKQTCKCEGTIGWSSIQSLAQSWASGSCL
jgi:hypothetical protein